MLRYTYITHFVSKLVSQMVTLFTSLNLFMFYFFNSIYFTANVFIIQLEW
jgi:hypothetical protein